MAIEFKLPGLGENIQTADVLAVKVKPGDAVKKDQTLLEIETDKATIEVPADFEGTITDVLVKAGDKINIGQTLFKANGSGETQTESAGPQPTAVKGEEKEKIATTYDEPKENLKAATEQSVAKAEAPSSEQGGGSAEFTLPELGENIQTADVIAVKIKPGDTVKKDQTVIEIETDKATIEVPSTVEGKVKEVFAKAGEKLKVGAVVFTVEGAAGAASAPKAEAKKEAPKAVPEEARPIPMQDVKPVTAEPKWVPPAPLPERPTFDPSKIAPAAPTVRRFAREIGVDINQVKGTGPGGRISIPDVKAYSRQMNQGGGAAAQSAGTGISIKKEALPDFTKFGEVEVKDMSNIRRKTAEHLSHAWNVIPHVTQFDKADITEIENLRKNFGKKAEAAGGKLTVTAVLVKVIASALKAFPQFNSSVDMDGSKIIYKKYINIGVAVDTDRGLIVPVIKDADKKNIIEISVELNQIAEKARNKKTSLEDMQGGCFSISNLGGIGGTSFTPVVNWPEVAILGVSRGAFEPVYIDGKFEPRLMLPLSLSYDHRVIDGADAARFLKWVTNAVQQPFLLALEG